MVLNSNRRVAVTAGEFLNDVIERVDEENNSGSLKRAGFNVRWLRYIVTSFIKLGVSRICIVICHVDVVYRIDTIILYFYYYFSAFRSGSISSGCPYCKV